MIYRSDRTILLHKTSYHGFVTSFILTLFVLEDVRVLLVDDHASMALSKGRITEKKRWGILSTFDWKLIKWNTHTRNFKGSLPHAFSTCIYCMMLHFQINNFGLLKSSYFLWKRKFMQQSHVESACRNSALG